MLRCRPLLLGRALSSSPTFFSFLMKALYSLRLGTALLLGGLAAHAQNRPAGPAFSLGSTQRLVQQFESQVAAGTAQRTAPVVSLPVSATRAFNGKVNYREDLTK